MAGRMRTLIGMAMIAAGVLLAAWALYELVRIGSCASGGPYVSARECPPGTGLKIFAIMGGIVLTLTGAVVVPGVAIAGVAWGLGFTMLGAAFFVAAFGPAAPPEADSSLQWVGALVGGMFLLMGLPGLFAIFGAGRGGGKRGRAPGGGSVPAPAPVASAVPGVVAVSAPAAGRDDDPIEELERLAKLRAAGALTEEEFQAAKARVLGP
ncbi:MAG: SHOCT domain-containing protein [Solirubrobacteraceae bacterium]